MQYVTTSNHASTNVVTTQGNSIHATALQCIPYYTADLASRSEIEELRDELSRLKAVPKMIKLTCINCGAPINQRVDDHLVKCKYCQTAYFIGTNLINLVEG